MKIYYRTKILVNGILPVENFKIDDFTLKLGLYDETTLDQDRDDYTLYSSGYLTKDLFNLKGKEGAYFTYFENDVLFEKTVDDNLSNQEISHLLLKEQNKKINMLQKKIRLITGLGISLSVFHTTIYDSNNTFLTYFGATTWAITDLHTRGYDTYLQTKLEHRLSLYIADSPIKKLEDKNVRFKNALYFYNHSFNTYENGIRFTLLISALESLFNITGEDITTEISKYSSQILFLSNKKTKSSKWKLINYYDIRSRFIHGTDGAVVTKQEVNNLCEYVREILIIYLIISIMYSKYDAEEIKQFIDNTDIDSLDIQAQLFIKYLRTPANKYKELFEKIKNNFINNDFKILNNDKLNIV